jgi:hypothetical protein
VNIKSELFDRRSDIESTNGRRVPRLKDATPNPAICALAGIRLALDLLVKLS